MKILRNGSVIPTANVEIFSNDENNLTLFNIEKNIENQKQIFHIKLKK